MRKLFLAPRAVRGLALAAVLAAGAGLAMAAGTEAGARRPNILLIVADDLGYSDIGAFGGEIATPNLDALARRGLRLTNFYASPFCSPTRAMLMSGADSHQVGFGSMAELLTPQQRSQPGYEGFLTDRALPFPVLLQDAGYHTYMAGKWHLGVKEEHAPPNRGFEKSYAMMNGGASHFDQTGIITFDAEKTPMALYREDGKEVQIPKDFYSSEQFASKLISYIDGGKGDGKPFFGYLAFTAPHWPLQARDAYIRKYEGRYDVGYDVIRERRLARMKTLGIVPKDMKPYVGNPAWPRWKQLSARQQRIESRRMAVYAAMVESMDAEIGRVIDHLKGIGEYDNTAIFFMSDNGADGNTVLDEGQTRAWAKKHRDNSYENTGRIGSFAEYGPGWAQVGSTPFNMYKAFMYEGGIAVPSIVSLPRDARKGAISRAPAHVTDIAPTLLELAAVKPPGTQYQGREVIAMQGRSMVRLLSGQSERVHEQFTRGWEMNGRRAMRVGDWKIVSANKPWGTGEWELYHLSTDRSELKNLAASQPAKLKELLAAYERYAKDNGVVDFEGLATRPGYSNSLNYYKDVDETD
ncbi:arylsulfatase [Acidovorax cavernicola]|uniref:Arylsulfatase n=1 Tax=Acidovorax cavernicola TaxID=1675792 RepID=A0A9X8D2F2_9BURK|nr:arylsulfatase [Acidovorax cavernicola]RIX76887.1 arylsulfatase [Acidovorax cavernicola]